MLISSMIFRRLRPCIEKKLLIKNCASKCERNNGQRQNKLESSIIDSTRHRELSKQYLLR